MSSGFVGQSGFNDGMQGPTLRGVCRQPENKGLADKVVCGIYCKGIIRPVRMIQRQG